MTETVRNVSADLLSDNWAILKRYRLEHRRLDGEWQEIVREVYDHGDGVVVLPYDPIGRTVVLTRQFRLPCYLNGVETGLFIEAPAGLLDEAAPVDRVRSEAMEEIGYQLKKPQFLFDLFMSPGSVSERLHFYIAEIEATDQVGPGGGLVSEHEDIEVMTILFDEALEMIVRGEIRDAKTILLLQHLRVKNLL